MPFELGNSPALLFWLETGHWIWSCAWILNTAKFSVIMYVVFVQASLVLTITEMLLFWGYMRLRHLVPQSIQHGVIFQSKGSTKPPHQTWTFHSYIYCENWKVFHTACLTEILASQQKLIYEVNWIFSDWKTLKVLEYKGLHLERNCSL